MPLCGATVCGCAVSSVPASSGELNGHYPTIDVAGNGTTDSPWNLTLNAEWVDEVVDLLGASLLGPSEDWNLASVKQPGAVAVTTAYGSRRRLGDTAWMAHIALSVVGTGSAGNAIHIALPYTLADANAVGGSFTVFEAGVALRVGSVLPLSTTEFRMVTDGSTADLGIDPSFALGAGDGIYVTLFSV